jgi:hypothetical protein
MKRSFALALTILTVTVGIGASGASAKRMINVKANRHSHVQQVKFGTGAPTVHAFRRAVRGTF